MPYIPHRTGSTEVRARLDHPVVDCDGHLREFLPEWLDYMVRVGGQEWGRPLPEEGGSGPGGEEACRPWPQPGLRRSGSLHTGRTTSWPH